MQLEVLAQAIANGILIGGVYSLVSIGLTLIFGVLSLINFAHGEFLMVSMYITYGAWALLGLDPLLALFLVLPLMFLFGMLVQRTLFRPILDAPDLAKIFMTVGLGIVLQNVALVLFSANYRSVTTPYSASTVHLGPVILNGSRLIAFAVSILLTAVLGVLLLGTDIGKAMRAAAQDREVAMLVGINPHRVFLVAVGLGAALTGAAGTLLMPFFYVYPTVGVLFTLKAFVVAIAGGLGSVRGAFIMGLLIGGAESLGVQYVGADAGLLVAFVLLLLILTFRPQGLFTGGRL